jgi:tripartite-type tricarboxylate transporter receptor subunit TctC
MMAAAAATVAALDPVCAQEFPAKPIRIVTGGVGGNSDFSARVVAQGLTTAIGQPVIVENRGGAAIISGQIVAKATPDGYTLLLAGGTFTIGDLLTKVPYPYKQSDFAAVSLTNSAPNALVTNVTLPVKTVKDLIALAKAKPGELNYATGENGSSSQIAAELFNYMAGLRIPGIHYSSGSVRSTDLMGGRVQIEFATLGSVAQYIKSGRLNVIAVTSAQPSALMPGVPTIAATGLPGYESISMTGILAPARTPEAVITRLNQGIVRALAQDEVRQSFLRAGIETVGSPPQVYAEKIKAQREAVSRMIASGSLVLE